MKKIFSYFPLLLLALFIMGSCSKNDPQPIPDPDPDSDTGIQIDNVTLKTNAFIHDVMSDIYLWSNKLPDIDYKLETSPKDYFYKLLYVDDKWSFITDDVVALENSFQGIEKSFGWSLAFGRFSNTGNIFAIVEYVYPNTPAANAGLKRGDIIVEMNNGDITDDNYRDLLYAENTTSFTLGILGENGISTGDTVSMTPLDLTLNPVVKTKIIDYNNKKIAYLFYAQYIANFNVSLDTAIQSFINQGATDLILDLRYNPGGGVDAAQHLCSLIAPKDVVSSESKLVTFRWNDKYQTYFENGQVMNQLQVNFDPTVPVTWGLQKIHILTGSGTASASELTITGLDAYMDVVTVGDTTYGKYTASITFKPEDWYEDKGTSYYKDFQNWGLQPIVLRYANAYGVTDFKDGFAPDFPVKDDLFNAFPLGDINDPLVKKAVEDITGTEVIAMKSARKVNFDYQIFDRGFSKYDRNKRELPLDFDTTKPF